MCYVVCAVLCSVCSVLVQDQYRAVYGKMSWGVGRHIALTFFPFFPSFLTYVLRYTLGFYPATPRKSPRR